MFARSLRIAICAAAIAASAGSGVLAAGPENQLAGIALGRQGVLCLKKYGNPTRVIVGSVARQTGAPEAAVVGPEYGPTRGVSMPGGLGEMGLPDIFRAGALPGVPSGASPGTMLPPGYSPTTPSTGETVTEQQVTWRYELANGVSIDVLISAGGLVTQITVAGQTPWALSKTSRGIKLGATYKDVLFKYGYPESHESLGSFLRASYLNKAHAVFTFLGKSVVGITVALPAD